MDNQNPNRIRRTDYQSRARLDITRRPMAARPLQQRSAEPLTPAQPSAYSPSVPVAPVQPMVQQISQAPYTPTPQAPAAQPTTQPSQQNTTPAPSNWISGPGARTMDFSPAQPARPIAPAAPTQSFQPPAQPVPVRPFQAPVNSSRGTKQSPVAKLSALLPKKVAMAAAVVVLLFGVIISFGQSGSPFPKAMADSVKIKLYYPTSLPGGYHLDKSSIQATSARSVQFDLVKGKDTIAVVESQGDSSGASVILSKLTNAETVHTAYGNAEVGNITGNQASGVAGSLVTSDGSWVTATEAGGNQTPDGVAAIFKGLKQQ